MTILYWNTQILYACAAELTLFIQPLSLQANNRADTLSPQKVKISNVAPYRKISCNPVKLFRSGDVAADHYDVGFDLPVGVSNSLSDTHSTRALKNPLSIVQ